MSTLPGSARARVEDVLRANTSLSLDVRGDLAATIVNAVYPEIVDAVQMRGVPERSILAVPAGDEVIPLIWRGGLLWIRENGTSRTPESVIEHYGPLTVVWMP